MDRAPLIFLSAGEASGDHYGAELILALQKGLPGARFTGLGGREMEQAGQVRVIRAEDVAVMGITEILRHIPRILHSYRTLVRSIQQNRPDAAVLIDFPDVNFRLAKHLRRLGVPVIWFVGPQLWAWKRRRIRWVQSRVDRMIVIFPFEQPFYATRGVAAEFAGHPLTHLPLPSISREEYAQTAAIGNAPDAAKPWIALLPGSRGGEITANFPAMLDAATELGGAYEFLVPIAPTVSAATLKGIQQAAARLMGPDAPHISFVRDARAALLHSRAAVVASGTATVQAAVIGTPFVVVYRVSNLTFRLAKHLVRYPLEIPAEPDVYGNLPVAMVNLVAGQRLIPELLQEHFNGPAVAAALRPLLADGPARDAQLSGLAEVRRRLLAPDGYSPIERLAREVLAVLPNR